MTNTLSFEIIYTDRQGWNRSLARTGFLWESVARSEMAAAEARLAGQGATRISAQLRCEIGGRWSFDVEPPPSCPTLG